MSAAVVNPDRLRTKRQLGVTKNRSYVRVSRVAPDIDIVPFNHDFSTLERAVKERVFKVKVGGEFVDPPRPKPHEFARRLSRTAILLKPFLPKTAPISYKEFVSSYSGRKGVVYQNALDRMRNSSWNINDEANVKVFVKYEKTDCTTKIDPVPRVISPRSSLFNLRIGRFLKPLEKRVFRAFEELFQHPTIIKGYNSERSAELLLEKWEKFNDPVAIGLDASRFDQHVSVDALKWEHQIYLDCFPNGKDKRKLAKLLELQLVNNCTGYAPDGELKYTIEGTRMSGDMNTSLGNCVLMCSMIHAYGVERGVKIHLANNGDDCVVFLERKDLDRFSDGLFDWFIGMGFNMAIEPPAYEFGKIEFCQTKPVYDGHKWLMVRNPITAITKDSVMMHNWGGEKLFRGWLDAVGTGGIALTGGVPIFQSFYRMFVRSGQNRSIPIDLLAWSMREGMKGMSRSYGVVSPQARSSFYDSFGITPDEQVCLEKHYDSMTVSSVCAGGYAPRSVFV